MKKLIFSIFIITQFLILSENIYCQTENKDSKTMYELETNDGNKYIGTLISINEDNIEMNTESLGIMKFPKTLVKNFITVKPSTLVKGKIWNENPQSARYFWAPNGYGLEVGEGYYQNIWVLWNQASIGLTRNFSLGVGVIPLFLFNGAPTPVWIAPKFSIPIVKDKFNIGAGVLAGAIIDGDENLGLGLVYGTGTYGNKNKNVSLGLGYGYADGEWANSPIINLSGLFRLTPKSYFITENYYIGIENDWGILSMNGFRFMLGKAAIDAALIIPFGSELDSTILLPWLGFAIPFHTKQIERRK